MDRKWWTLAAVVVGVFMLLLDVTIVNVALPDIERQFNASLSEVQWVIDAYALTLAALLLTAGSLADLLGPPPSVRGWDRDLHGGLACLRSRRQRPGPFPVVGGGRLQVRPRRAGTGSAGRRFVKYPEERVGAQRSNVGWNRRVAGASRSLRHVGLPCSMAPSGLVRRRVQLEGTAESAA